ncbi:hypothetical protein AAMO2058_000925700 [Amorphochlora amoebiformis]
MNESTKQVFSGSMAGIASTIVCHPLDTIRTRLQTAEQVGLKYNSPYDCARRTWKMEGWRAFYKGFSSPLMAQAVYKSVLFLTYHKTQTLLNSLSPLPSKPLSSPSSPSASPSQSASPSPSPSTPSPSPSRASRTSSTNASIQRPGIGRVMVCGAVAGGVNSFVVTPVELIRNNLMVQRGSFKGAGLGEKASNKTSVSSPSSVPASTPTSASDSRSKPGFNSIPKSSGRTHYRGPIHLASHIITSHGILGMWKGIVPAMIRDSFGVAAWFGSFELSQRHICPHVGLSGVPGLLFSGVLGGVGYWIVAFPMDTIKSMVQVDVNTSRTRSVASVISHLWTTNQMGRLYRGISVALTRGVPGAAITFAVQRKTKEVLDSFDSPRSA